MEELVRIVHQDASSSKTQVLQHAAKEALELFKANEIGPVPSCLFRRRILECVRLLLEAKSVKYSAYSIGMLKRLHEDSRFMTGMENDKEEDWLPLQVLNSIQIVPKHFEEVQIDVLKYLLNLITTCKWCMKASVVVRLCDYCVDFPAKSSSNAISTAAKAASFQALHLFAEQVRSKDDTGGAGVVSTSPHKGQQHVVWRESVAVLQYLGEKLAATHNNHHNYSVLPLLIECILMLLQNLRESVCYNQEFIDLLWRNLIPNLMLLFGNPVKDRGSILMQLNKSEEKTGAVLENGSDVLHSHIKFMYRIGVELVRLVGNVESLRPVLYAYFQRMLLAPPSHAIPDLVKAIKELFRKELFQLAGPPLYCDANKRQGTESHTALLKLFVQVLRETFDSTSSNETKRDCVECVLKILDAATIYAKGEDLNDRQATAILCAFQNTDKQGSANDQTQAQEPEQTKTPTKEVGFHQKTVDIYFEHLCSLLTAAIPECSSRMDVDDILEKFCSTVCEVLNAEQKSEQGSDQRTIFIFDADGLYITTLHALKMAHQLCKSRYYEGASAKCPVPPKEFVDSVINGGVHVCVSPSWLEGLHQRLTKTNLFQQCGVNVVSDCPLVQLIESLGTQGSQLLSEFRPDSISSSGGLFEEAGFTFARYLVLLVWNDFVHITAAVLCGNLSSSVAINIGLILGTEKAKEELLQSRTFLGQCVDAMIRAAQLACRLGLYSEVALMVDKMMSVAVRVKSQATPDKPRSVNPNAPNPVPMPAVRIKIPQVSAAQILVLEALLQHGLEMASYSPGCWKPIFRYAAVRSRSRFAESAGGCIRPMHCALCRMNRG